MKAIVQMGFTKYVMDAEKAVKFMSLLEDAEVYEEKWNSSKDKDGKENSFYTHHVYNNGDVTKFQKMEFMQDAFYKMAKLAGKPESK